MLGREDRVLAHLLLGPGAVILKVLESAESVGSALAPLDRLTTVIERGTWHKVVVEVHGRRIIAQLDGRPAVAGESPPLDIDKTDFRLSVEGTSASFDYIRMYEAASK